ncbi:MAG: AAA family ATPase [Gammaproteobacteria bacterium]|nr:AAA family ATPase [Gammaproteobacteria bacterium]
MNKITLENFRCFREKQEARLAPLTLLVGENSTGKTSFLALIRALWDVAFRDEIPNFKEDPYDLGSYDEIAHFRGGESGRADRFEACFDFGQGDVALRYEVAFEKSGTVPVPVKRKFSRKDVWAELQTSQGEIVFRVGEPEEKLEIPDSVKDIGGALFTSAFLIFETVMLVEIFSHEKDSKNLKGDSLRLLQKLFLAIRTYRDKSQRPYASAPVRTKPRRTYDPASLTPDSEGEYIPMYLADLYFRDKKEWGKLKGELEKFGHNSGLFDEISVRPLRREMTGPFQLLVRKFGNKLKGPQRNLVDVGYGVSQVLPVVTELLRPDAPNMSLMQQPEVHLHPSAQAALGSLFCELAGAGRQLVVETHSDHLLERVRLDIRDGASNLKPEDVSILYFERKDIEVEIHSLGLDKEGNVLNAPPSYGRFFMEETKRSLKL